jgi:regulator of cell morphogenesis and NO signaling
MQTIPVPTVAEIAANSLEAVRVFERLGIDYCCGGKRPLSEVCRQKGYDFDTVQHELDEAIAGVAAPDVNWSTAPLRELVDHIVGRHHEYLRRELPALTTRITKVYRVYNQRYGPTLTGLPEVFAGVRAELEAHIQKEEMILFPVIVATEAAINNSHGPRSVPWRIRSVLWKRSMRARAMRLLGFVKSPRTSRYRITRASPTRR